MASIIWPAVRCGNEAGYQKYKRLTPCLIPKMPGSGVLSSAPPTDNTENLVPPDSTGNQS